MAAGSESVSLLEAACAEKPVIGLQRGEKNGRHLEESGSLCGWEGHAAT